MRSRSILRDNPARGPFGRASWLVAHERLAFGTTRNRFLRCSLPAAATLWVVEDGTKGPYLRLKRSSDMPKAKKARAIGFNHVALEVGDIDEALAFYGRLFDFKLRGKSGTSAFIDLGDQFLALQKGRKQGADDSRHFGLVV